MQSSMPYFSLYEIAKPKFSSDQILIRENVQNIDADFPKPSHELAVEESGKIVVIEK